MKHLIFVITILMAVILTASICVSKPHNNKVICRVETEKSVLFAGPSQEVIIKVTLDAPMVPSSMDRPPVNLSVVLDKSGSMGGEKIKQAKAAAIEAVKRLGVSDVFSLVVYDSNVHTIIPAQSVRNINQIISKIQRISAAGSTALFGGVSQAASEIRKYIGSEHVHRIILLSVYHDCKCRTTIACRTGKAWRCID